MVRLELSVVTSVLLSLVSVSAHSDRGRAAYNRHLAREHEHLKMRGALASTPTTTGTATGTATLPTAPPLSQISMGMPTEALYSVFTTFPAGASPPIASAPPLPSITAFNTASYPVPDQPVPTDSPRIASYIAAVRAANIPDIKTTKDGTCEGNPEMVPNAGPNGTCWWTCGGCTRSTDIVSCPDKMTYGVSYDDGPTIYTPKLLDYMNDVGIKATFFVVGSRAFYAPQLLQTEYMLGHSLSVHTWSHPSLTTLTNDQIAAELAWTMLIMKDITGLTPNTMRPPYGDIDDRVRAVCKALGLTPIIWSADGDQDFDTEDWKVAGGTQTSEGSLAAWEKILQLATDISTGFIVLSHDLYQVSVDLAVSAFLPLAVSNTALTLKPIHECLHEPLGNFYMETTVNTTSTTISSTGSHTGTQTGTQTGSTKSSATKSSSVQSSGAAVSSLQVSGMGIGWAGVALSGLAMLGGMRLVM